MLKVNQLIGFGSGMQIPTLRQADFLLLPSSSRVAIDGTGGFPDIGGNVGTVVNAGTRGGSVNATTDSNRGTLQSTGGGRLSVRGQSAIQMAQTFTALTGPTVYAISAFIPRVWLSIIRVERILSLSLNSTTVDYNNAQGGVLITRENETSNTWGVYRNGAWRGGIALTQDVLTVLECIAGPTETRICKDGGTDTVTSHSTIADFNVSSLRILNDHGVFVGGAYDSPSDSNVLVLAVFFTNPTADFRARALAEVRTIAGIPTP